jgi:hypothetical protein
VDGLGDSFAILGVSLWTTLPPLVPHKRHDRLGFAWSTRLKTVTVAGDRRDLTGVEHEPLNHAWGGPIGPPLLLGRL